MGSPNEPAGEPAVEDATLRVREDDLQAGLDDLSRLIVGSQDLEELLTRIAASAVVAVPGADGVGVFLLAGPPPERATQWQAASHPFVREVDVVQYEQLDEGPCITAMDDAVTVVSSSLDDEQRWPRFTARARRIGVRSVLSLPLQLPDDSVVGALNVYSRRLDAFDEHAALFGAAYAASAAVAAHNARLLHDARTQAAQLRGALVNRAVIDQAIGILRSRSGGTANESLEALKEASRRENVKLAVVAERIVEEAARRARARRGEH